jgi:hypothetical protein
MKGVYQHCAEKASAPYLAEFDFRYSNRIALGVDDQDLANKAIREMVGIALSHALKIELATVSANPIEHGRSAMTRRTRVFGTTSITSSTKRSKQAA